MSLTQSFFASKEGQQIQHTLEQDPRIKALAIAVEQKGLGSVMGVILVAFSRAVESNDIAPVSFDRYITSGAFKNIAPEIIAQAQRAVREHAEFFKQRERPLQ